MIFGTIKLYRLLLRTLRGEDSPRQAAFGVAFGMLVGLIPPDSLFAVFFATLILATRVNLLSALLSGFVTVWIGHSLDPWLHRLGLVILSNETLEPIWTWLYAQPIAPWTRFNNTVVMGSTTIGLALFYPVYQISEGILQRFGPTIHERLARYGAYRRLAGITTNTEATAS